MNPITMQFQSNFVGREFIDFISKSPVGPSGWFSRLYK
jgi:hypothetical protein